MLGALTGTLLGSPRALSHYSASCSMATPAASESTLIVAGLAHAWRSLSGSASSPPSDPTAADASAPSTRSATAPSPESPTAEPRLAVASPTGESRAEATSLAPSASPARTAQAGLPPSLQRLSLPQHVMQDLRPPVQPYTLVPKQAQRPTSTPALYTPWTPTRALQRRGHVAGRMGFLMHVLEREQMERVRGIRPLPDFKAGDVLELRMMVPEAERKVMVYRGVCIARYNKGIRTTFKIYNVFPESGGVVQHIPLYMPDLLGLKVVGRIPAKQERLYYLLERETGTSEYTYQNNPGVAK